VRTCTHCVLPDTFPGIKFTEEGICQYCRKHKSSSHSQTLRQKYLAKFQALLGQLRTKGAYDALMGYSGGKDSSYTLKILKEEFHLRVLAVTFDHGFVSPQASKNIQAVTHALGVDHVTFAPSQKVLCHAFRESITANPFSTIALQRASSICTTCMNLVKSYVLKTAIEMGVPLIAYGWSPGQAPIQSSVTKLNSSMVEQAQGALIKNLQGIMGKDLKPFVLSDRHFHFLDSDMGDGGSSGMFNIHPLAFHGYDEQMIVDEIGLLGWQAPKDTDSNSTNCLLNGFANQVHLEKYGFHPYAHEIAGLVREGFMTREKGLAKLAEPSDEKIVAEVKTKLGIGD
jgi:hypothetical protein